MLMKRSTQAALYLSIKPYSNNLTLHRKGNFLMQRPLLQKIVSVNDRTPVASRRLKIVEAVFSSHSLANFLPKLKVTDS